MINKIFYLLFLGTKSLKSGVFYTYSTSRLELATFQVLSSRKRLMATVLDGMDLKKLKRKLVLSKHFLCTRHCGSNEYALWLAFTTAL